MSRYKIWNKEDKIITPVGEVLTPDEWIKRYPVANVLDTVCSGETINGAFFGIYNQMVEMYTRMGCDFSACTTQQEYLDAIEAFEDNQNTSQEVAVTDQSRIADALEDLVVATEMPNKAMVVTE